MGTWVQTPTFFDVQSAVGNKGSQGHIRPSGIGAVTLGSPVESPLPDVV
ncbi:MAG TPA: hypothetical protein VGR16_07375 [Thermomicrobiales bacterium]|nr:hypothetical protein [Thermomicrobiales bacterium]